MGPVDEAAFRDYVTAHSPSLLRLAYLLTGDRGHAEDAVQSTLSRVYLAWGRIAHREALDSYCRRALVREVSSWRRRRRVTQVLVATPPERVDVTRLRLSNPTSQPIVLSPCPNYSFIVTRHQRGGLLSNGGGGALACHEPPAVVPAYGSVTFDLPDQFSNAGNGDEPIKGSLVQVEVLFPGGPTATAMLHVG